MPLKLSHRLTGQEEQIGGFDLICKGVPVKNESSLFSTMLGSHNNRSQQLKKLAKIIASKLSQQEKEATKRITSGKDRDGASTAATDTSVSTIKSKKITSKIASNPLPRTNKPPINKPTPPTGQQLNTTQSKETKDPVNSSMRTVTKPKAVDTTKPKTAIGLPSINSPAQAQQRVSVSNTNNILSQPSYPPKSLTNITEKISGTASYKGSKVENPPSSLKKNERIPAKPINKVESLKRPASGRNGNGKLSDDEISTKKQPLPQRIEKIPTKEEEQEEQNLSDDTEEAEEREEDEEEEEEDDEEEEDEDQDNEEGVQRDDEDDEEEQIQPNRRVKKSSEDYE